MTRIGLADRQLIAAVLQGTCAVYELPRAGVAVALLVTLPGDHTAATSEFVGIRAWPVADAIFQVHAALAPCATFLAAQLDTAHAPQGGAPVSSRTPRLAVSGPAAGLLRLVRDVHCRECAPVRSTRHQSRWRKTNFNEES